MNFAPLASKTVIIVFLNSQLAMFYILMIKGWCNFSNRCVLVVLCLHVKHSMHIFLNESFSSLHKKLDLKMRIQYNTYTVHAKSKCKSVKTSLTHDTNNQNVSISDVIPVRVRGGDQGCVCVLLPLNSYWKEKLVVGDVISLLIF